MRPLAFFKDCRLARMSDGHYCLLRDLGPVKGAKGMKHHEVVIDFSRRGLLVAFRRLTVEKSRRTSADGRDQFPGPKPFASMIPQIASSA
jgi:hypothetical protein